MRYLGGKQRISKEIANVILTLSPQRDVSYYEPFVGGGSMCVKLAPHFKQSFAGDTHEDLILLYKALQMGWLPPDYISEDDYKILRAAPPSALRGFAGFGYAFGGDWFRGYSKDKRGYDYAGAAKRAALRDAASLGNVLFIRADYRIFSIPEKLSVVYCDPPYAGTSDYSVGRFDSAAFWDEMRRWRANGAHVYVSEYSAPPDWTPVWRRRVNRAIRGRGGVVEAVCESLYV